MKANQRRLWIQHTAGATADSIVAMTRKPYPFQEEFAKWFNGSLLEWGKGTKLVVCEAGSEFGVTTLLLDSGLVEKHCIDFNPHALALLSQAASALGESVTVHEQDMFHLALGSAKFDVVFNNGVLEHYDFAERRRLLGEFARLLKPGGRIIIGVPNHQSVLYRLTYKLRVAFGRWPYPEENPINDLVSEAAAVGLCQVRTLQFDHVSIFQLLPKSRILGPIFRTLNRWVPFRAYLKVFELVPAQGADRIVY